MKSSFLKESLEVSTGFLFFLALDFFLVLKTDWDRHVPLCMTFEGPSAQLRALLWREGPTLFFILFMSILDSIKTIPVKSWSQGWRWLMWVTAHQGAGSCFPILRFLNPFLFCYFLFTNSSLSNPLFYIKFFIFAREGRVLVVKI